MIAILALLLLIVMPHSVMAAGPTNPSTATWTMGTLNADSSPLDDLSLYNVRVAGPAASAPSYSPTTYPVKAQSASAIQAPTTAITVSFGTPGSGDLTGDLGLTTDGQYWMVTTAVDLAGNEGAPSNVVAFQRARAAGSDPACAKSTTIFCEDWEAASPLPGIWAEESTASRHAITTTPANVHSGAKALETTWSDATGNGAGWFTRWFRPDGTGNLPVTGYDQVFVRMWIKFEAGLTCDQNCPKLFTLSGSRTDSPYSAFGQAGICPNGTDFFYAGTAQSGAAAPARQLIHYDYDPNMQCAAPVGQNYGVNYPMSPTYQIPTNTWTCIETEVQLNTAPFPSSNGVHRTWVNDQLKGERTNVRWRDSTILNLNSLKLEMSGGVVPPTNHIWYDDIVVARERIYCATTAAGGPTPPGGIVLDKFYLQVGRAGAGAGTVTGPGINCGTDCVEPYDPNASVTLAATPTAPAIFAGWSGACTGTGSCVVTMSQPRSVTATFTAPMATLLVTKAGTGTGTITSSPAGINCGATCTAPYVIDSTVTLTATPSGGGTFAGWGGVCSGTGACVVTMAGDRTVTATFTAPTTQTVTLAWTDTNTTTNEDGTAIWMCQGGGCDPLNQGAQVGTVAQNVTQFIHNGAPPGVLGYGVRATSTTLAPSGFSNTWYTPQVCPCYLWGSAAVPAVPANNDPQSIEVGIRFQSTTAGYIKGVRFYKGTTNTGPHTGKLWSAAGALLASAPFTSETASGWQEVLFATPVAITANTTYVASYYTASGNYPTTVQYFNTEYSAPPLKALATTNGGNGMFLYATGGGFPTQTFNATNYWVDVVFDTVAPTTQSVTLRWSDTNISPNNETATEIFRCQGVACAPLDKLGEVIADVTTFTDSQAPAGVTLGYTVRAKDPPTAFTATRYITTTAGP